MTTPQHDGWDVQTTATTEADGTVVVKRRQLVADHVDYCKARANEGHHGFKDFRLRASFPVTVIEAYCRANGITLREWHRNREHVRRMVNDPALADFRVAPGRM